MTPEEAINVLLENVPKCCKMIDGRYRGGFNDWDCDMGQAIRLAVLALQDIRNYRNIVNKTDRNELAKIIDEWLEYSKIGTVKECREAVERLEAKPVKNRKILRNLHGNPYGIQGDCPNCGCERITSMSTDWCHVCGQHLKYDENLEGMEGGTGQV